MLLIPQHGFATFIDPVAMSPTERTHHSDLQDTFTCRCSITEEADKATCRHVLHCKATCRLLHRKATCRHVFLTAGGFRGRLRALRHVDDARDAPGLLHAAALGAAEHQHGSALAHRLQAQPGHVVRVGLDVPVPAEDRGSFLSCYNRWNGVMLTNTARRRGQRQTRRPSL